MKLRRGALELERTDNAAKCQGNIGRLSNLVEFLIKNCLPHFDLAERTSEAKSLFLLCPTVLKVVEADLQHAWWWEAVVQALAEATDRHVELMLELRDAVKEGHITAEQLGQATEIARQSEQQRLDAPPGSGEDLASSHHAESEEGESEEGGTEDI